MGYVNVIVSPQGATTVTGGVITVRDNSTDGENNTNGASSYGGALNSGSGTVKLKAADEVLVSVNAVKRMTSWASGGAISAYKGITIEGGSVTVRDNTVATASSGEHKENNLAHGGALNSSAGDVTIAAAGAVALSNNALTDIGGSATPIGASANVVGCSVSSENDRPIGWGEYCKYSAPATIIVITISMLMLFMRYAH